MSPHARDWIVKLGLRPHDAKISHGDDVEAQRSSG